MKYLKSNLKIKYLFSIKTSRPFLIAIDLVSTTIKNECLIFLIENTSDEVFTSAILTF